MNKPAVCIATIRPDSFIEWADAWRDEFKEHNVQVFAMVDAEKVTTDYSKAPITGQFFCHEMVKDQLKDKAWIIPSKTSACKSFAIYKAWQAGCDPIMVLDDDCLPDKDQFISTHKAHLSCKSQNEVFLTISGVRPRGVPHIKSKPIAMSHGLWLENPDVDAATHFGFNQANVNIGPVQGIVPMGALFPMSGMNLAFRREIAPLMYFGLQGPDWGVDRFDDIWCGFLAKKVLDHCGYAVWSGTPYVRHIKASDPFVNIVKEAPGYKMNVELYYWLMISEPIFGARLYTDDETLEDLSKRSLKDEFSIVKRFNGIAENMLNYPPYDNDYWSKYAKAIQTWLTLFEPEEAFGI